VKLLASKERMVEARQLNETKQTEEHGETREQNGQLEHHWKERRYGKNVGRFRLDDRRVDNNLSHIGESESRSRTSDTTEENEPWKNGPFQTHRRIKSVDRIWGVAIPFTEARIADFFCSLVERRGAFELGEIAINSFSGSAHVLEI